MSIVESKSNQLYWYQWHGETVYGINDTLGSLLWDCVALSYEDKHILMTAHTLHMTDASDHKRYVQCSKSVFVPCRKCSRMLHGFPRNHHSYTMTAFSHTINTPYVSVALNDSVGSMFLCFEVIMPFTDIVWLHLNSHIALSLCLHPS